MRAVSAISTLLLSTGVALAAPPIPTSFDVAPGYRLELVAREPLVVAPVSLAFDADGRLLVAEMRTYMNDVTGIAELSPRNRVAMLHDDDGNGTFDRRTDFLNGLALPRGATPFRSGVLVIEPPWLLFAADDDGDGRADSVRRLLDGFGGLDSPEHAGNGPIIGLDGWLEFSQHPVRVRFDGSNVETMPVSPHGQWGLTMDNVGRLYYSPNSHPVLVDAIPKWLAPRYPHMAFPAIGRSIVPDTSVFPSHPTPGVNRGYQENVLRPNGRLRSFTAACGPAIVRTTAMGRELSGAILVCEPAGNLVSAYELDVAGSPVDGVPTATRLFADRELLRSSDERFRPVACALGPDGAIYIADIARGVIQHRIFLTDYLRAQITARDLEGPIDRGRIWRLVPTSWSQPAPPRLSGASNVELVAALRHENGWWRDTAQRLLVERMALDVDAELAALLADERAPTASRIHALRTRALLSLPIASLEASAAPALLAHHTALLGEQLASGDADAALPLRERLDSPHALVRQAAMLATGPIAGDPGVAAARESSIARYSSDSVGLSVYLATTSLEDLRRNATSAPDPILRKTAAAVVTQRDKATSTVTQPEHLAIPKAALDRGRFVYATCAACHGADARGVAGAGPALASSTIVKASPERLVRAILHGVDGGMMADGRSWPAMTPLPLNDPDIVAVVAYVRATFGACTTSIDQAGVAAERARWKTRARPWTVEELQNGKD